MHLRAYEYVDVYYNPEEQDKADKEQKRLERLGFELQVRDDNSEEVPFCDQYLRLNISKCKHL